MAYKVLIIGCGAIAGGYDAHRPDDDWPLSHAGAIARSDAFELAACVDPDDAAREAFAARWKPRQSARDLSALNAAPGDYDLIVVASPTRLHADHLRAAHALSPKAVFCEKPLAKDLGAVPALLDAYERSGVSLAVNHTRRWAPDMVDLARDVRSDGAGTRESEWGDLISAMGVYAKGVVHNGSHMVDLVQMLLGPCDVQSVGRAVFDHWSDDPSVSAVLERASDASSVHLVAGDSRAFTQFELVLTFARGEIAIRDGGMRIETRRRIESPHTAGYWQLGPAHSAAGRYDEAMSAAYDNIAQAIEAGAPLACDARRAFEAQSLCERIRRRALANTPLPPPYPPLNRPFDHTGSRS